MLNLYLILVSLVLILLNPFLVFMPHSLGEDGVNLDTFADFTYYSEDSLCVQWHGRMHQ